MTLPYATRGVRNAAVLSRLQRWTALLLILVWPVCATLAFRAVRWDRWANYENTHRPWYDGFGG